ncbi:hypothetical protein R3P38DRAFT_2808120 [Favolaschia claudopus]|uniref:Uncharacterized protein n=1 Tax=Favolaschia claudopus TaxID=2862362 RepID=A0AAV9ZHX8_9AGAR
MRERPEALQDRGEGAGDGIPAASNKALTCVWALSSGDESRFVAGAVDRGGTGCGDAGKDGGNARLNASEMGCRNIDKDDIGDSGISGASHRIGFRLAGETRRLAFSELLTSKFPVNERKPLLSIQKEAFDRLNTPAREEEQVSEGAEYPGDANALDMNRIVGGVVYELSLPGKLDVVCGLRRSLQRTCSSDRDGGTKRAGRLDEGARDDGIDDGGDSTLYVETSRSGAWTCDDAEMRTEEVKLASSITMLRPKSRAEVAGARRGSPDRARYGQRNLDVSLDGGLFEAVFSARGGMSRTDAPSEEGAATASTSETEERNARSVAKQSAVKRERDGKSRRRTLPATMAAKSKRREQDRGGGKRKSKRNLATRHVIGVSSVRRASTSTIDGERPARLTRGAGCIGQGGAFTSTDTS